MNKETQFKFIEDNYPLEIHHISKRSIRHSIFSTIKTELQAYLLGFYAADGSIDKHRKTLRIHLQESDKDLVNLYKDIICPQAYTFSKLPHKTTGRNGQIINAHLSYGIDITSSQLCQDLCYWGFGYQKSNQALHLPKINKKLLPHFIRGYFDGDGSFVASIKKPKNRPNLLVTMCFSIISKTPDILIDMQKLFAENNIIVNINYIKRDNLYRLTCSSKKYCRKIFKFLYTKSNFYLKRKFNKFEYYANTEDVQLIADACNAQAMNVKESNNLPTSSEHPIIQDENIC